MSSTAAIDQAVERMLRHDRMIVLGGLILANIVRRRMKMPIHDEPGDGS